MKVIAGLVMLLGLAYACRQGEPTGDPKTPVNSPLPQIERREADPKSPTLGDAG